MKAGHLKHIRILAIYPSSRGFGFAVLEDGTLVDWGFAKSFAKTKEAFLTRLENLVDRYRPSHMTLEDFTRSRRRDAVRRFVAIALAYACQRAIQTTLVSRTEVRAGLHLGGNASNHDVAVCISRRFTELAPLLPRRRRLWESEAERIQVFQAVGLAVAAMCGCR